MHTTKDYFNFDQCQSCELVFLNPRLSEKDLKKYYTPYYLPYRGSSAWGKFKPLVEKSQQKLDSKKYEIVKTFCELSKTSTLLDIGCGKPTFLKKCVEKTNCKAIGVDFSDNGWKDNINNFQNIDLQVNEVNHLNKDINPDIITMWHYLEHDYAPQETLKHLKAISKTSTTLIIEVPNFDSHSRRKFGEHWAAWHTPRHTSLFSPNNITTLLEQSGWKVKQVLPFGSMDAYLLYWMSRMEQKQIQWDKSLEGEFFGFVLGLLSFSPLKLKEKKESLGIMTVIATPIA